MASSGPDGVEAWCISLSACFINFVMGGLGRMSGIFYIEVMDTLAVNRLQASVPFTTHSLTRYLMGPIVGIIGQKYGVRAAAITGGILGTVSAAACFYTYDMLWLTVMWGVLNGIALGLTITLPQVILCLHFEKYRTTACGIAISGSCIAAFIFPSLLGFLLPEYGLGGTFLILAGIIMNIIPAAMLLNKPSWISNRTVHMKESKSIDIKHYDDDYNIDKIERQLDYTERCLDDSMDNFLNNKRKHLNGSNSVNDATVSLYSIDTTAYNRCKIDIDFFRENILYVIKLLNKDFCQNTTKHQCHNIPCVINGISVREMEDILTLIQSMILNSPILFNKLSEKNNTAVYTMSFVHKLIPCSKSRLIIKKNNLMMHCIGDSKNIELIEKFSLLLDTLMEEDYTIILQSFHKNEHIISRLLKQLHLIHSCIGDIKMYISSTGISNFKINNVKNYLQKSEQTNSFLAHTKTAFRLHSNPLFLLVSLSRSVYFITHVPIQTVIVDFSKDKGLSEEDGKYAIAVLALGDIIGRLFLGWITDRKYITLPRYMLIVMVLMGVSVVTVTMMHSRITLFFTFALYGILQGSLLVRHPILVSNYLERNEQSVGMGCINFFSGLLGFTLPNYIGYFRDTMGSYDYIFHINGSIAIFIGILWIFEPNLVKRCKQGETIHLNEHKSELFSS